MVSVPLDKLKKIIYKFNLKSFLVKVGGLTRGFLYGKFFIATGVDKTV